jgi:hypothetical protein
VSVHKGYEEKSRLGRLLVGRGYLSETQLEEGLRLQRQSGDKLGEILIQAGWITQRDLNRVLKQQSRYRKAAALVTVVAVPFQPLVSMAATNNTSNDAQDLQQAGELYSGGFAPLTDEEMSAVQGQGTEELLDRIATVSEMPASAEEGDGSKVDAIENIKLAANIFVPVLNFLDSDLTITGVHYRDNEPRYEIEPDGGLKVAMPERIEQIRMDNIRVGAGASMGHIAINNIRFAPGSSMTIHTR